MSETNNRLQKSNPALFVCAAIPSSSFSTKQLLLVAGITPQLPEGWLATAVPGMTAEFNSGAWAADGLLGWVLSNLGTFWWQSHTLSHLARDDLGASDCAIEDGGESFFLFFRRLLFCPAGKDSLSLDRSIDRSTFTHAPLFTFLRAAAAEGRRVRQQRSYCLPVPVFSLSVSLSSFLKTDRPALSGAPRVNKQNGTRPTHPCRMCITQATRRSPCSRECSRATTTTGAA